MLIRQYINIILGRFDTCRYVQHPCTPFLGHETIERGYAFQKSTTASKIVIRGNEYNPCVLATKKILFTDTSHYSIFFMPNVGLYGEIIYLVCMTTKKVTVHPARTNLSCEYNLERGFVTMFWSDTNKWILMGMVSLKQRRPKISIFDIYKKYLVYM